MAGPCAHREMSKDVVKTVEASTPKDRKTLVILKWRYSCKKLATNNIFSSVSCGYKAVHKTDAWNAITHAVNAVSGEGRRTDEVKKKWFNFNLNSEAKKHVSKHSLEDS